MQVERSGFRCRRGSCGRGGRRKKGNQGRADALWRTNELRDPRILVARALPLAAPATQAAMVRRAQRREKEMLAGVRSGAGRMKREKMLPEDCRVCRSRRSSRPRASLSAWSSVKKTRGVNE